MAENSASETICEALPKAGREAAVVRDRLHVIGSRVKAYTSRLVPGLRADTALPGARDVPLDSRATQRQLRTKLRGAHDFLVAKT